MVGKKIRAFREFRGYSQIQLAELSGINVGTIRKYELGIRNPKPDPVSYTHLDVYKRQVPFCSHSIPYFLATSAKTSFSCLIHWLSSVSRLLPPGNPRLFSACFKETFVSIPFPVHPLTYGTKSTCKCGVDSSRCK